MNRGPRVLVGVALAFGITATFATGWAATKKPFIRYPTQLHGMWIPETAACPELGQSYDGDTVMHIGPRLLQGYEEQSKPTGVVLVSQKPMAWRIESVIDIGPSGSYERDVPRIFVLGKDRVTVVAEDRAEIYRKCEQGK